MNLKSFILIIILVFPSVHAVDYISHQDSLRCEIFAKERDALKVYPFTCNISTRLTDHQQIDYSHIASHEERRVIYKAMMASVIVHNRVDYYRTHHSSQYNSHFKAVEIINDSAKRLWELVRAGSYLYDINKLTEDKQIKALLTDHFIEWFYETLESYKHELNFFAGTASPAWLRQANAHYKKNHVVEHVEGVRAIMVDGRKQSIFHKHIFDDDGVKIAVLKPKSLWDRNRKKDVEVSLAAKALGFIDVINPVIPVRIDPIRLGPLYDPKHGSLIVDPVGFDYILEPFVGLNETKVDHCPSEMKQLLNHVLQANSESKTQKKRKSHIVTQRSFARYFENDSIDAVQRYGDLQVFNASVDTDNLVKLLAFLGIFRIFDMYNANLLWTLTPDNRKFSIVSIDYNLCFDRISQWPPFSMLKQANNPIQSKSFIEDINIQRLFQAKGDLLGGDVSGQVSRNLIATQKAFREGKTLRDVMYKLIPPSANTMLFYSTVSAACQIDCNPYVPIEVRPCGMPLGRGGSACRLGGASIPLIAGFSQIKMLNPSREFNYVNWYGSESCQVRKLYDWVFFVEKADDLRQKRFFKSINFDNLDPFFGQYMWNQGYIELHLILNAADYPKILPG